MYCPSCGKKKNDTGGASTSTSTRPSNRNCDSLSRKPENVRDINVLPNKKGSSATPPSLSTFMKEKETERRSHFEPKNKKARNNSKDEEVHINVGLMEFERGEAKPVRGKTFPVKLSINMGYDEVFERSLKKWKDYDRTFSRDRGYILVYPDGRSARTIPGSSEEFTLQKYKEGLGKSYARIAMYLCPVTEIKAKENETKPITSWLSDEVVFNGDFDDVERFDQFDGDLEAAMEEQASLPLYTVADFL